MAPAPKKSSVKGSKPAAKKKKTAVKTSKPAAKKKKTAIKTSKPSAKKKKTAVKASKSTAKATKPTPPTKAKITTMPAAVAVSADKTAELIAVDVEAVAKLQADPWDILTKERLPEAKVISAEVKAGVKPKNSVNTMIKYRGSDQSEEVLYQLIELCRQDRQKFDQRIEALSKI